MGKSTSNKEKDAPQSNGFDIIASKAKPPNEQTTFHFDADDYSALSQNEYCRFLQNSPTVGHAVITYQNDTIQALQFSMPSGEEGTPEWTPLHNIHPIQRYGQTFLAAETLDGQTMYSRRKYQCVNQDGQEFEIRPFSPPPARRKEPFWGSKKMVPISDYALNNFEPNFKGGRELIVDPESVEKRSQIKRRKPTQKKVMGNISAKDAYVLFRDEWEEFLTPEMQQVFERAIEAPLRNIFYSNYRPEWLHAEGFSLTPMWINPQRKDNLGSAPKWANTAMMVLERLCKWFALNCPEGFVSIKPQFEMLFDSALIKTLDFEVQVGLKDRFLRFMQHIEPLCQASPMFKKASDIAQVTGISHALLTKQPPIQSDPIAYAPVFLKPSISVEEAKALMPSTSMEEEEEKKEDSWSDNEEEAAEAAAEPRKNEDMNASPLQSVSLASQSMFRPRPHNDTLLPNEQIAEEKRFDATM